MTQSVTRKTGMSDERSGAEPKKVERRPAGSFVGAVKVLQAEP